MTKEAFSIFDRGGLGLAFQDLRAYAVAPWRAVTETAFHTIKLKTAKPLSSRHAYRMHERDPAHIDFYISNPHYQYSN
ncbi:hypothetical protein HT749_27025 [Burkholderia cepacia]|uniref:hypothetical protein n=1 Tax=Burkholderia cepacia TaxID=292 RepID=UPI00157B06F5|nr:hypothetical protein [Burkholderia cepacia]NTX47056.1 hypothetical protein [Burkholderia cepacia]